MSAPGDGVECRCDCTSFLAKSPVEGAFLRRMAILGPVWYRIRILDPFFMDNMNDGSAQESTHHAEGIPPGKGAPNPSNERLMAALSYVGILCLIPLIFARHSAFVQVHAKQGLVLAIIGVVVQMLSSTLWRAPFGGLLVSLIGLGILVVSIMGILKAFRGEKFEIQYISDWARKIHF